jgi:hypothetical protein
VREIQKFEFEAQVITHLRNILWNDERMKKMNGRGIVKHLLSDHVLPRNFFIR